MIKLLYNHRKSHNHGILGVTFSLCSFQANNLFIEDIGECEMCKKSAKIASSFRGPQDITLAPPFISNLYTSADYFLAILYVYSNVGTRGNFGSYLAIELKSLIFGLLTKDKTSK